MSTTLAELLRAEAGAIVEELACELRRLDAPHYRALSDELLRLRCQRLVEAFLLSSGGNPRPFEDYVRQITSQRISEGYYLAEMQEALRLLEQRAWQLAVDGSNVASVVRHLGIITGTIGRAKDELARAFCAGKRRAEAALARIRPEALFAGTEGHVEPPGLDLEPRAPRSAQATRST